MYTITVTFHVEVDDVYGFMGRQDESPDGKGFLYRCRATSPDDMLLWGYGDTKLEAIREYIHQHAASNA